MEESELCTVNTADRKEERRVRIMLSASKRCPAAALGVVLLAVFGASSCTSGGDGKGGAPDMKSYEGEGFSVSYPAGWKKLEGQDRIISNSKFEVAALLKGSRVPNASLDILVSPAISSLRRASEDLVVLSRSSKGFKLIEDKETSVSGGAVAYRVVQSYEARASGRPVQLQQTDLLTATRNDEQVDLRIVCQVKKCPAYQNLIDRMLVSVKLE